MNTTTIQASALRRCAGLALILAGAASLSGCFSAPVNPCEDKYGGICTSPRSVYGITNERDQVNPTAEVQANQTKAQEMLKTAPKPNEKLPDISSSGSSAADLPSNVMRRQQFTGDLGVVAPAPVGRGGATVASPGAGSANAVGVTAVHPKQHVPAPILEQPKVVRVWVAPYVDNQDNLNFPGYIYSVIQPKTWNFGYGSEKATPALPSAEQVNEAASAARAACPSGDCPQTQR